MLEADRESDGAGADARGNQRRVVHAEMRGRRGMDHERFRVADVGQMREEREGFDEALSGFAAALELEGKDRAAAARIQPLSERVIRMRVEVRVMHALHG